jgi:hypothetical protein
MEPMQELSQNQSESIAIARGNVDDDNEPICDIVRSEWARNELSNFRRSTSARDYRKSSQTDSQRCEIEQRQNTSQLNPTPTTTPLSSLDNPDLRVNGMFLPQ